MNGQHAAARAVSPGRIEVVLKLGANAHSATVSIGTPLHAAADAKNAHNACARGCERVRDHRGEAKAKMRGLRAVLLGQACTNLRNDPMVDASLPCGSFVLR